jgi:hypothetical protein
MEKVGNNVVYFSGKRENLKVYYGMLDSHNIGNKNY